MSEPQHVYCVGCKATRPIKNPRSREVNGRTVSKGECPECGCKLYAIRRE